jgi:hypothetical protein
VLSELHQIGTAVRVFSADRGIGLGAPRLERAKRMALESRGEGSFIMSHSYVSTAFAFGREPIAGHMTLDQAAHYVRDGHAAAVLLDMVPEHQLDAWWVDEAYPAITQHASFPGAAKSGLSIGPVQRLVRQELVTGLIDYFSYGARMNRGLEKTAFVQACVKEMGATSVRIGDFGELPLASKREYKPNDFSAYSIPPHCDSIHFGRDPYWPIKADYEEGRDQISIFLTLRQPQNHAGLILWDVRPESRAELDILLAEYSETERVRRLEGARSIVLDARPGQMSVLNTRLMHAVEACATVRQTVGSFAVWHEGAWRIFH